MLAPEALARENIDRLLEAAGWTVQDRVALNLRASLGVAVREFHTQAGPTQVWRRSSGHRPTCADTPRRC